MSKAKTDPDLARWCAALAAPKIVDQVPPGWHTVKQIAAELGKATPTVGALLCRAVADGRAERKTFRITAGQVTRPIPHYRLK